MHIERKHEYMEYFLYDESEAKYGLVIVLVKIQGYMYENICSKEKRLWDKEAR